MGLCDYPNSLSLEETTGSHQYLLGSAPLPHKKPAHVKVCRCKKHSDKRALSFNSRTIVREGRHSVRISQRKRRDADWSHRLANLSDDNDLARDCRSLPGYYRDHSVVKKRPNLIREEAFKDPTTSRSFCDQNSWFGEDNIAVGMNDVEVAELYHTGILNDEHLRGSDFNLDSIIQSKPVYSVRPAKKPRRPAQNLSANEKDGDLRGSACRLLPPLNLSFSDLSTDKSILKYFTSNPDSHFENIGSKTPPFNFNFGHLHNVSTSTGPITVIYEVDEEQRSQSSALSPPSEYEVPALSQGTDESTSEQIELQTQPQDINEGEDREWTFLPTPSHSPLYSSSMHDGENTQEMWIVLGDDS